MRRLSISSFLLGVFSTSLIFGAAFFVLTFDYEQPLPKDWDSRLKLKFNPVTVNVQVIDTETRQTLFWYNVDGAIQTRKVEKDGAGKWIITIEDLSSTK